MREMTGLASALLAPDEPAAVRVLRAAGTSDFVFTADHAGKLIPRSLGTLGVAAADLERHIAWDIGIAGVTERLSAALDATAALQTYSRLVIDCNRDPSWPSAMPVLSEFSEIPGNSDLTAPDRAARTDEIFRPYHDRIAALIDARTAAGRGTILVAMHSFTPVFKGEPRQIEIGVLYFRRTRLAEVMLELLRQEPDLTVGENAPYALTETSDYSIPYHAERRGLEHVEIEIRQDLIATPEGQSVWANRFAHWFTLALPQLG
jgi:predicted N-formylglutamate amidohydrolase